MQTDKAMEWWKSIDRRTRNDIVARTYESVLRNQPAPVPQIIISPQPHKETDKSGSSRKMIYAVAFFAGGIAVLLTGIASTFASDNPAKTGAGAAMCCLPVSIFLLLMSYIEFKESGWPLPAGLTSFVEKIFPVKKKKR